jgi:hypothetical protein
VTFLAIPKADPLLGGIGLGAGILAGLADTTENALYVVYALAATNNNTELAPWLPLHYLASGAKWMAAFAAVGIQLLVLPRRTVLERIIVAVMITFPVLGSVSIAWPALAPLRAIFLLSECRSWRSTSTSARAKRWPLKPRYLSGSPFAPGAELPRKSLRPSAKLSVLPTPRFDPSLA